MEIEHLGKLNEPTTLALSPPLPTLSLNQITERIPSEHRTPSVFFFFRLLLSSSPRLRSVLSSPDPCRLTSAVNFVTTLLPTPAVLPSSPSQPSTDYPIFEENGFAVFIIYRHGFKGARQRNEQVNEISSASLGTEGRKLVVARTDRRPASKRLETMLLRRAFTHSRKRIWIVRRTFTTPARENRWPAIIYDVAAANESRATRIAESPLLATGRGWGIYATYILRADTNRWVSSLPNWLGESRGSRSPLSTPSPSPFPPQDATLRYRDKFPRIARAFSPFSPSFRELRRAAISTRIYMYISPRRNNVHFLATRGNSVRGEARRGSREDSFAPFLFQKKACRGESHGSRGAACPFRV